jgi:GcrA cell cycle regulator
MKRFRVSMFLSIVPPKRGAMLFQLFHHSRPGHSPALASGSSGGRRRWTTGELTEIVATLAALRTSAIAHAIGVNPKALRSALRRRGISLRALRENAKKAGSYNGTGLLLRRPIAGASAVYGAAALACLPEGACRWPLGDPAEPGFAFCGAPRLGRRPYCGSHCRQAVQHEDANAG